MRPSARILIACLALGACSEVGGPPLVASDIVITEPIPGSPMSAGYLTLRNNSDETISISSVTSSEFASVDIHESSLLDGIATMQKIDRLSIFANSTLLLEPSGIHLMLMHPDESIDKVSLSFYGDDTLLLDVKTPLTRRQN
jgi:copper(I)-binding protein